ncbi:MAG TPA: DUF2877 domain-containing protein [Rugosimonospora sp.]|nr:DUF2877 domain-containing protein [Rugosimonospora sp.]
MISPIPVAASAALAPLLTGAPRGVEVIAVTPAAVYLATGDPYAPAVCVCTPEAVRVPCATVLPSGRGAHLSSMAVGDRGRLGAAHLLLGSLHLRLSRWFRPSRPHRVAVSLVDLGSLSDPGVGNRSEVQELIGWGPGMTPVGDDVVAGMLVTWAVVAPERAARLAGEVGAVAHRTTAVSAALLRHAGRGECVPQLTALLHSEPGALAALLRVGHTSGTGLAWGVRMALIG